MRFHTPELIARLYSVRAWSTPITALLAVAGAALLLFAWPRSGSWTRGLGVVAIVVLGASVAMSRQYLIEWVMFEPAPALEFVEVAAATHVAPGDLVLAVDTPQGARAYPVLMAAYHHIFNDEVDGEPFVVTY